MFEPSKLAALLENIEGRAADAKPPSRPNLGDPVSWQPYKSFYTRLVRFPHHARPFSFDDPVSPLSNAQMWLLSPGTFHPRARVRKRCVRVLPQYPQVALASDLWISINHFFLDVSCSDICQFVTRHSLLSTRFTVLQNQLISARVDGVENALCALGTILREMTRQDGCGPASELGTLAGSELNAIVKSI